MNTFAEPVQNEGLGRYVRALAIGYTIGAILGLILNWRIKLISEAIKQSLID